MCAQVLLLAHLNISTAGGLFRDDDGVASRSRVGSHGMRKSGTTIIIITFGKKTAAAAAALAAPCETQGGERERDLFILRKGSSPHFNIRLRFGCSLNAVHHIVAGR